MEKDFQKLQIQQTGAASTMKAAKTNSDNSQHPPGSRRSRRAARGAQKGPTNKRGRNRGKKEDSDQPRSPDQNGTGSASQADGSPQTYFLSVFTVRETVAPPTSEGWRDDPGVLASFPQAFQRQLRVNGMPVSGLFTTGAGHTRLHSRFVCPAQYIEGESITVQDHLGQTRTLPRARVTIELDGHAIPMKVGVCEDLPIGCLMGRDILAGTGMTITWSAADFVM